MADIVFVAIGLAFFALCVLYVRWCDNIMGPDEVVRPADAAADAEFEELAA
jgi:hypothetical protein